MFCRSCGKEIGADSSFCLFCGAPLSTSVIQTIPVTTQPPVRQGRVSIGKIILVVIIIIVILGGIGAYALLRQNNPTSISGTGGTTNTPTTTEFTVWKGHDAHQNNRLAFQMLIPKGWTAQGGVQRYQYPFGNGDFNLTAKDATRTTSVFFSLSDFPLFIDTTTDMSFQTCVAADLSAYVACGENTWWLPPGYVGMKAYVHGYMTAANYLQLYSNNQLGFVRYMGEHPSLMSIVKTVHPDVQMITSSDNPNLKNRIIDVTSNEWSGAEALFTYTDHGQSYKLFLQMLLTRMSVTLPGFTFSSWSTYYWGYSALVKDFDSAGKTFATITPTVKLDKQWAQDEVQRSAHATQLIAHHTEKMIQMQYSLINSLAESQYKTGQGMVDALGGSQDVYNPQNPGTYYKVPLGYNYYYDCGLDKLLATNDANYHTTCTLMKTGIA